MKRLKIAIIAHGCRTGGGLFGTLNLLRAFKNVAENEQFLLVCSAGYGYEDIELPEDSELFIYNGRHNPIERSWFESITLPKVVGSYDPDVIFGLANIGLTKPSVPQALFIRQAYLFYDKRYYPDIHLRLRLRIAALKSQIKKSLPGTKLIFGQTPIVRRRFSNEFCYPEGRIKIVRFPAPAEISPVPGLEAPSVFDKSSGNFYILLLTRYMPHRNPSVLIPLCRNYGGEVRSKHIKFITTIELEDDYRAGKFLREISRNDLEDIIINVGDLSREEVLRYFCFSDAFWFPTTLETLGIPFIEAMRMGVPILAPDIDFARYVCGEAALFYNPWDIKSIFSRIMLVRDNAAIRQQLVEKGKRELGNRKKFSESWEEVAADVLRELRLLVKSG